MKTWPLSDWPGARLAFFLISDCYMSNTLGVVLLLGRWSRVV